MRNNHVQFIVQTESEAAMFGIAEQIAKSVYKITHQRVEVAFGPPGVEAYLVNDEGGVLCRTKNKK